MPDSLRETIGMRVTSAWAIGLLFGLTASAAADETARPSDAPRVYGPADFGGAAPGYPPSVPGYGFPPPAMTPPPVMPVAVYAGPAWTFRNPLYSGLMNPSAYSAAYQPGVGGYPVYFRTYRPMWMMPLHRPWGLGYGYGYGFGGFHGAFGPYGLGSAWNFPGRAWPPQLAAPQFSILGAYGMPYGCAW